MFGKEQSRVFIEIQVFGRLTSGFRLKNAQAELTTIGLRLAAEFPDTHSDLRPEVLPYAQSIRNVSGLQAAALQSINIVLVMLLLVAVVLVARAVDLQLLDEGFLEGQGDARFTRVAKLSAWSYRKTSS